MPSGTSLVSTGDDTLRQHWASLQSGLIEEHFFSDSSSSAGIHKLGSARIDVQTGSQVSSSDADDEGRLLYARDVRGLFLLGDSAVTRVASDASIVPHTPAPTTIANVAYVQSLVTAYVRARIYPFPQLFASGTTPAVTVSIHTENVTRILTHQLDEVTNSDVSIFGFTAPDPTSPVYAEIVSNSGSTVHIIAFGEVAASALS